jgi:hypothetical protein
MKQDVKALLVFCEGPHDVAFVSLIMKSFFSFNKVTWRFSEYPAPFNQMFHTSVEQHAAQDLSLDMAHKFFLPDQVLIRESHVVLLFNSGGKTQKDKVKSLLSDFLPLLENAKIFPGDASSVVTNAYYLFLYDADDLGAEKTREECKNAFSEIEGHHWLSGSWIVNQGNPFSAVNNEKAVYIWGETCEKGTLEDLLIPLFNLDNPELINNATIAIDDIFSWDVYSEKLEKAVAEDSKRKKAIITLAGQRKKPGGSMNVILDQAKMISKATLISDKNVMAFAHFIMGFAELNYFIVDKFET